jgi:hypothetical protein
MVFLNNVLAGKAVGYIKPTLEMAGLHLEKLSDLPRRVEELVGVCFNISVRTNGYGQQDVYVKSRLARTVPTGRDANPIPVN